MAAVKCCPQMAITLSFVHPLRVESDESLIFLSKSQHLDVIEIRLVDGLHEVCEGKQFLMPENHPFSAIRVFELIVKETIGNSYEANLGYVNSLTFVDSLHGTL